MGPSGRQRDDGDCTCEIEGYSFHFGRPTERHNPTTRHTPSHESGDAVAIFSPSEASV